MRLIALILLVFTGCAASTAKDPQITQEERVGTIETGGMAIGGETTGTDLRLADGTSIEVVLPKRVNSRLYKGRKVKIKGHWMTRAGVERLSRQVFEVEQIELAQ